MIMTECHHRNPVLETVKQIVGCNETHRRTQLHTLRKDPSFRSVDTNNHILFGSGSAKLPQGLDIGQ